MKLPAFSLTQSISSACIIVASLLPNFAKADYLYTYTSNPFPVTSQVVTDVGEGNWITVENTFASFVQAEIRTATLLTPGVAIIDVISLQLTGMPYEGFTKTVTFPGPPFDPNSGYNPSIGGTLNIDSLDASGLPTAWTIFLGEYVFLGGRAHYIEMETSQLRDSISGYDEPYASFSGMLLGQPGTWQMAAVSPVPEPETYGMLLAGLGILATMARRRSYKQTF